MTLAAMLLAACPAWAQSVTPANVPLGPGEERVTEGTARLVSSLFAYVRWPERPQPVRLCVAGPALYAGRIGSATIPGDGPIAVRTVAAGSPDEAASCDALYVGGLNPAATARAIAAVRGRPVITIAENDPTCQSEAMFCLLYGADAISFRLNVDAVSRSAVRVDPRVLRMARGQ